jgi:hypothetical protein
MIDRWAVDEAAAGVEEAITAGVEDAVAGAGGGAAASMTTVGERVPSLTPAP